MVPAKTPRGPLRPLMIATWSVAILGLAAAVRLMLWYWPGSLFLRSKSDIWTALAWNAAHGEFYRPLLGPHGYGGTRYMPLLFLMHGGLIRLGFDPIRSGMVLMQLSVAAAAGVLFAALRRAGARTALAAPLAATSRRPARVKKKERRPHSAR